MHLCHAEECITSVCFAALFLILALFLVQYLSHNLGHTPPRVAPVVPPSTPTSRVGPHQSSRLGDPPPRPRGGACKGPDGPLGAHAGMFLRCTRMATK